MNLDHAVIWVESSSWAFKFYAEVLGLEPIREQEFADGRARFPSVRFNEATIFYLMEREALLSLVQKFTGGGMAPINYLCLSMSVSEYGAVSTRLAAHSVELRPSGKDIFGAQDTLYGRPISMTLTGMLWKLGTIR